MNFLNDVNVAQDMNVTGDLVISGGGTIAITAASLPLPTGAATETTLAAVDTKLGGALTIATHAVTQSGAWNITNITGTVSLPTGAATQTTLAAIDTKLGGTLTVGTHAVTGTFWQATQPVSIASMPSTPVTGTFWQATQPVSGTLSINSIPAGTNNIGDVDVLTLPTTIATNYLAVRLTDGTSFYNASGGGGGGGTVDIDQTTPGTTNGVVINNASLAVTGTFWQATQPVSGTLSINSIPAGSNNIGDVGLIGLGTISTANSSTSVLAGGAAFTGTSEDVSDYAEIRINVTSSHISAVNGISIQQSSNGTNWDIIDTFSILAGMVNVGQQFSVPVGARYFRLVYTNGATLQTTFRLQTMFNKIAGNPNSHRLGDDLTAETDVLLTGAVLLGFDGTGYDRIRSSGTGVLTVGGAVTITSGTVTTVSTVSAITALMGQGAAAATIAGNPVRIGARAATANPTAVTDNQSVNMMADKVGRIVTTPYQIRDMQSMATVTLTTTTETTLIAAVASTFNDIVSISFFNSSATGTTVSLRTTTGGTVVWSAYLPATSAGGLTLPIPMKQAAVNTNWTVQLGTAVTDVRVNVQYVANL